MDHDQRIVHSSEDPNWRTPRPLFDALNRQFHFTYDFAADEASTLVRRGDGVGMFLGPGSTIGEDALTVPWAELHGRCGFINPPYSRKLHRATKNPAYDIANWARKCWQESQAGATIVGLFPLTPQTRWYRNYVMGHRDDRGEWSRHAAMEEWRLAHRVNFERGDGAPSSGAGHNVVIIVWRPNPGFIGPWEPATRYWSYRP